MGTLGPHSMEDFLHSCISVYLCVVVSEFLSPYSLGLLVHMGKKISSMALGLVWKSIAMRKNSLSSR